MAEEFGPSPFTSEPEPVRLVGEDGIGAQNMYELPGYPHLYVRAEHEMVTQQYAAVNNRLIQELSTDYGIRTSGYFPVIVEAQETAGHFYEEGVTPQRVIAATQKVEGIGIMEALSSGDQTAINAIYGHYSRILAYITDKSVTGKSAVSDMFGNSDALYGSLAQPDGTVAPGTNERDVIIVDIQSSLDLGPEDWDAANLQPESETRSYEEIRFLGMAGSFFSIYGAITEAEEVTGQVDEASSRLRQQMRVFIDTLQPATEKQQAQLSLLHEYLSVDELQTYDELISEFDALGRD